MSIRIRAVGYVDIGNREKNDDRILLDQIVYDSGIHESITDVPCSFAICDGVGGEPMGDIAAEVVLNELKQKDITYLTNEQQVSDFLAEINKSLFFEQESKGMLNGMKTTIVGLNLYLDCIIYYNSGDSRLYRCRNRILRKLSEDHNLTQDMLDKGVYIENYETELMKCNCITRCLGDANSLPSYVHKINNKVQFEDIYLLCSDGLWGVVSDIEIEEILIKKLSLKEKIQELYWLANKKNSQDNISIILAEVVDL